MSKESWSILPSFPEYMVSNQGRVKRLFHDNGRKPGFLKPYKTKDDYLRVDLQGCGVRRSYLVHILVLERFGGPKPSNDYEVNHIDGRKDNNSVSNLEWVTRSENLKHAHKIGLKSNRGMKNPNSKLKNGEVWLIKKLLHHNINQALIGDMFKVSKQMVSTIACGYNWKHINYE